MPMKIAVSIPDPLFEEAERVSQRLRIPRSQLYSRALQAFVREHSGEEVTARMNAALERIGDGRGAWLGGARPGGHSAGEVVMRRGEVWWVDFGIPFGSEPGYRRPAVIVQADALNKSAIGTVLLVPAHPDPAVGERRPATCACRARDTGLKHRSVANVVPAHGGGPPSTPGEGRSPPGRGHGHGSTRGSSSSWE